MSDPHKISTVLITGATGSFGRAMTGCLLNIPDGPHVRIYSRDEDKQETMSNEFPPGPRTTYILGDVRDAERLTIAADGCDAIIHSAALKRVGPSNVHSDEFVKTNVLGTKNVIVAARENGVSKTLLISSDKAVLAINPYGKGKAAAESLMLQANALGASRHCKFSIVRGGNVWASRGSVMLKWAEQKRHGQPLTVTGAFDSHGQPCTRFHLPMSEWTAFVWRALNEMRGGEIMVPKIRAWTLNSLAEAFESDMTYASARHGDKPYEVMLTADETYRAIDAGWCYCAEPLADLMPAGRVPMAGKPLPVDFEYSSRTADLVGLDELKRMVAELC